MPAQARLIIKRLLHIKEKLTERLLLTTQVLLSSIQRVILETEVQRTHLFSHVSTKAQFTCVQEQQC